MFPNTCRKQTASVNQLFYWTAVATIKAAPNMSASIPHEMDTTDQSLHIKHSFSPTKSVPTAIDNNN